MVTLANSEDPDEIPKYAAFHQGLNCLLRQNRSSEKKSFIYTRDHPDLAQTLC